MIFSIERKVNIMKIRVHSFIVLGALLLLSVGYVISQVATPPAAPEAVAPAPAVPEAAAPAPTAPDAAAVPAPVAPDAAAVPAPVAPNAATTPAPALPAAPAEAEPAKEVSKPVWPDTVEVDKVEEINVGAGQKAKHDLFKQSNESLKNIAEVIASLDELKKNAFNDYLKLKKNIEAFVRETKFKLGRIKETSNE